MRFMTEAIRPKPLADAFMTTCLVFGSGTVREFHRDEPSQLENRKCAARDANLTELEDCPAIVVL